MSYIFIERGVRMNRKEYLKKWREDNKEHIQNYKKEYAKTHDSSFKKLQDKYKQLQQENKQLKETYKEVFNNYQSLKEYIKETKLKEFEKSYGKRFGKTFIQAEIIVCNMITNKIQELEQGSDSNE